MTTTVQQAVAAVIAELPGIGKGDKSPEGYIYRGIEAVTREVQPLLAKHGVVLVPSAEITDVRPSPAMKDGWQDVYMRVSWTIVGPDGSTLSAQTFGIGRDRADKGANKAMTQAFKYLLLDLLCISDAKDDADGQTYEHDRHEISVPAGWVDHDECKQAHDEMAARVKASGAAVHMREWRTSRRLPWPMSRDDLAAMGEELQNLLDERIHERAAQVMEENGLTPEQVKAHAEEVAAQARAKRGELVDAKARAAGEAADG